MDGGTKFIETLKRIGYSKAASLNGEDFDWLFETLEDKSFLEWFCTSVNEHHVLSEGEMESFNILQKASKPVLEEVAVNEVLKTCKPLESNTNICEEEEEEKLKALEDEFQVLQQMKKLKIHRRNRIQIIASDRSLMSLKLKEEAEEIPKHLKESQGIFTTINIKMNNELQSLSEGVEKLLSFVSAAGQQEPDPHSVLLVQHALDKYLCQEEQSTAALTSYTKKQFFQCISELVESSNEGNFQLLDVKNSSICKKTSDVCEERQEMTRLQMAYICALHQLIQQRAKNLSVRSGLRWAEENIPSLKKIPGKEKFEARISSLNNDISKTKKCLAQLHDETLPLLIKEDSELLNMPMVRGDFDLQIARQEYYMAKQDHICTQLIKQKASFEVLQLAYEIELSKLRDKSRFLESMVQDLKQNNATYVETLKTMSEPSIAHYKLPRSTIDSKDNATQRLYQLLEGQNPKELFRTHDSIQQMAEKLHVDTISELNQLAATNKEQILLLAKMDADVMSLHDCMHCSGESISLSNQELVEEFDRLEFRLNKLNQLIMNFLADIKTKKKVLENNKLQQTERKLYVYFFTDEERLKNVVERLEKQVKAQAIF